jgi:hypothetical protein
VRPVASRTSAGAVQLDEELGVVRIRQRVAHHDLSSSIDGTGSNLSAFGRPQAHVLGAA